MQEQDHNEPNATSIPQWQIDEVRKRIEFYKEHPELLIDEATFLKMLGDDAGANDMSSIHSQSVL